MPKPGSLCILKIYAPFYRQQLIEGMTWELWFLLSPTKFNIMSMVHTFLPYRKQIPAPCDAGTLLPPSSDGSRQVYQCNRRLLAFLADDECNIVYPHSFPPRLRYIMSKGMQKAHEAKRNTIYLRFLAKKKHCTTNFHGNSGPSNKYCETWSERFVMQKLGRIHSVRKLISWKLRP